MASRRRSKASADSSQSVWPHIIVGFLVVAVPVGYLGTDPQGSVVAGCIGAVLGYLRHCWKHPLARCWWPTWFWLGWFGLQGCQGRSTTSGKYYGIKPRCPLHPNSPVYVRLVARALPTKRKPPKDKP